MGERNPYMDYRNYVPFMNLSGFIVKQPTALDDKPVKTLQEELFRKRFTHMVNEKRMRYRVMCEVYRNEQR